MMSQASKFDQFIYGKLVGNESGYRLVSCSENLKNNISDLEEIHEESYYFWGNQSSGYNRQAVGICRNKTQFFSRKKSILIQAAPAFDKDKKFFFKSGSRSFFQHRYIFISEAEIAKFNNRTLRLLEALYDMQIPTFSDVNLPYDSENNSWLLGEESFLKLLPEEGTNEKVKNTINKIWKKLPENGKKILLQALAVILNGKRLLLTGEQKAKNLSLRLLDNILLFLPTNARNKISLAIGSVDPEYCKWAQIIVKLDGYSVDSLPENMVWLDFNQQEFDKEQYLDHEYVEDFIVLNKDKYENLITLCEYLDNTTQDDSDNLAWEFQEVDGWLKLNNPSIGFIFNYPAEDQDKFEIFAKYIPRMKEKLQSFLNLDKFEENLKVLELLWKALPSHENNGNLMKTLLCKIYRYLPEQFLEIVKTDKFFYSLDILLENEFIDSLAMDYLVDKNIMSDILQELQKACLKLIKNISQEGIEDLYNKSGDINTELPIKLSFKQQSAKNDSELENLIISCQKIFRSEKEKFKLWDLALVEEITSDNFKRLFIERLFMILPKLEPDIKAFDKSNLKQYWQHNFPNTLGSLTFYLLEKEKGIFHVPEIANGLELSNYEASQLFMTCLTSHSSTYEQNLPLLKSAIEKSVSFLEERLKFQIDNYMEVYKWFNYQYFQGKYSGKVDLLSILGRLVIDSNSNRWISWEEISNFLDQEDIKRTIFLDKTIGIGFPVEMLEAWLKLLNTYQENREVEAEFIASKAWELLNRKTLGKMRENLTGTYQKYVGKFIHWANEHEHLDLSNDLPIELISEELIEYITEIWRQQKSVDEKLWNLLNSERILPKLSNKDCMKLIDTHWRLGADLLSLTLIKLYEKAKNFSLKEKEYLNKSAIEIVNQLEDTQTMKKIILYFSTITQSY